MKFHIGAKKNDKPNGGLYATSVNTSPNGYIRITIGRHNEVVSSNNGMFNPNSNISQK